MLFRNFISFFAKKNHIKTLFLVDILYMKDLNAIYGFENGDFLIRQLSLLLKSKIKNQFLDILKRSVYIEIKNTHADVFEIMIHENLTIEEILEIKNLVYEAIVSYNFKLLDKISKINIDVTIGCSKSDDSHIKAFAEKALHEAKLNYLPYMYYDSFLYKDEFINKDLIEIINYSIDNNLVEPYFQAIMDNTTDKIVKYEALMRIFDKNGNMIMPYIFIPKSKKSRLYHKLMEQQFDKIIDYIKKYQIHVSINLDYSDIMNPNIKKTIISKIKANNIGHFLTFEVLESEKVSNFDLVNDFISQVKMYGVKIAIDDFGTGFSNYENILNLNIDYIKIDGSLIKNINTDKNSYEMVKSIIDFTKALNIRLVAEFIHNEKVFDIVMELGVDEFQGFYLGEPAPHIE